MNYRIERRDDNENPTGYWNAHAGGWMGMASLATLYNESERAQVLSDVLRGDPVDFPSEGCWVIVAEAPAKRAHFTTIKLRPVAIRLSVPDADFEDLNAQALEFEAALRQWVKGQQVLTDGWMVDVLTDEE